MKRKATLVLAILTTLFGAAGARAFFPGYAPLPWGSDVEQVLKTYPRGLLGKLHDQVIYKQLHPDRDLRQRTFTFRNNRLMSVTISYSPDLIKRTGIDGLLAMHQRTYGPPRVNHANAPHLISYVWENDSSRVTFTFTPRNMDYAVLMLQQK